MKEQFDQHKLTGIKVLAKLNFGTWNCRLSTVLMKTFPAMKLSHRPFRLLFSLRNVPSPPFAVSATLATERRALIDTLFSEPSPPFVFSAKLELQRRAYATEVFLVDLRTFMHRYQIND